MIAWWDEDAWVFTKNGLTAGERSLIRNSRRYDPYKVRRKQKLYGWIAAIGGVLFAVSGCIVTAYLRNPSVDVSWQAAYAAIVTTATGFTLSVIYGERWLDQRGRSREMHAALERLEKGTSIAVIDKTSLFWNELTRHACWPHVSKAMRTNSHVGQIVTGMVEVTLTGKDLSASIKKGPDAVVQQARDFGDILHRVYQSHQATTPSI